MNIAKALKDFALKEKMSTKGPLCVALVVTRHAKRSGLPLNPDDLLTDRGGQVAGLGKSAVQAILEEYGVQKVLAEEGGRTSRGSVGLMRSYVAFLNGQSSQGQIDLDAVEQWWVEQVKKYFTSKPLVLRFDPSRSLRAAINDLLEQAEKRQLQSPGSTYLGTILQHLVGAKLSLLLGDAVEHHGASVADESSGRDADFLIEDVAVHVTTTPSEALIRKCTRNIESGLRPVVITIGKGPLVADGLAEQAGIGGRIDIFEAEQFLAGNLYELGKFAQSGRRNTAEQLVAAYNHILEACETDPSLRIDMP